MRIISGTYKGRTLNPPKNLPVRPTTDFARTGLFNMIENRYEISGLKCLDLFAGIGSISLELASRGCISICSVDKESGCTGFIKDSAKMLGVENLITIKMDAIIFVKRSNDSFDLIFADPPFDIPVRKQLHEAIMEKNILKDGGIFIMEHASRENFDHLKGFQFSRSYGNVAFSFFSKFVPS